MRLRSRRGSPLLVILLLALTALSGCSSTESNCLPEPLEARFLDGPEVQLHVSAEAAPCSLDYDGVVYELTVEGAEAVYPLGTVRPSRDGSFSAVFNVPPAALEDDGASIVVIGSPYDDCEDSGSADCVGYMTDLPAHGR
jgi:hypothetical protein